MKKFSLLLLSIVYTFLNPSILQGQITTPNFIIFIADDVSWNDFGCYGNSDVKTPVIDLIASRGIQCYNVYLTASSCSPSRNSIMTGRYPHNTGAAELHTEPPVEMLSFAEKLRENGYFCASSGKWHMGKYAERGFDVIFRKGEDIGNSGEESWLQTLQKRPKDKPFFMWFAALDAHRAWGPNDFSGSHHPDSITPPFYLAQGNETRKDLGQYYDEIKRFDYHIGLITEELKKQEELDNTLIIIMADNGRPFPHSKTRVNDRGMKTPFIISWPDKIKEGQYCYSLISAIDIAPTILEFAGIDPPETIQGISFDKILTRPDQAFRNYVFAEHNWHDYEAHERMAKSRDYMYILNSRPMQPQMGPADAVGSPSFKELDFLKKQGDLSTIQSDIFMVPRAKEELYDCRMDSLQLLNVASVPDYLEKLAEMRTVLLEWMETTGDNIPTNLTRDWYLHEPGYVKTEDYQIRGEMPGAKNMAVENDNKGAF